MKHIEATLDTGAVRSVTLAALNTEYRVEESAASRGGSGYRTASGQ